MNSNKTFRTNLDPTKPYYYIQTSLDLKGTVAGETLYFNEDNSIDYLENPYYNKFWTVDGNSIIGDVFVHTDPKISLASNTYPGDVLQPILCGIGGAASLSDPVELMYLAPAFYGPQIPPRYNGFPLTVGQLNADPISYFGHTAARFPYGVTNDLIPDTRTNLRYLGITFYADGGDLPAGTPLVESGVVHVTFKVYPK